MLLPTVAVKSLNLQRLSIIVQPVRYRRVNLSRPRTPHYEKQRVLDATKLKFEPRFDKDFPPSLKCRLPLQKIIQEKWEKQKENNPYEILLARELYNWMIHSKMILFFHRNSISGPAQFQVDKKFKKEGMEMKVKGKRTIKLAVQNTKYEPILQVCNSQHCMVLSPEIKLDVVFKLLKKLPHLILLAGIVEDKLMSRSQLEMYNALPDLTTARAQLVSTLNAAPLGLVANLNQHQSTLVSYLEQHAKRDDESLSDNATPPENEPTE